MFKKNIEDSRNPSHRHTLVQTKQQTDETIRKLKIQVLNILY